MEIIDWAREFPAAVTVCDPQGTILYMNAKSEATFQANGGANLLGKSLLDCHSNASNQKIAEMMQTRQANIYTIEKRGVKKLIYQSPWYQDGQFAGLVEISMEIPFEMPHFIRD